MKSPNLKLLLPLIAIAVVLWFCREPLRREFIAQAILSNDAPLEENVVDMVETAPVPQQALLDLWHSGKIIQRQVAIREIARLFSRERPIPPRLESVMFAATLDPDLDVRESAFAILSTHDNPYQFSLAARQLNDPDKQVRLLGLNYLKPAAPATGVPLAVAMLDDSDLAVQGLAAKLLEHWSGENFGVRLVDTVQVENKTNGLPEFLADGSVRTEAAVSNARSWWASHQNQFPPPKLDTPSINPTDLQPVPARDFELHTLDGKTVRLSDFRGKTVLINFWTTWCTACIGEMPELIALQQTHSTNLVILGVSLDLVPDEDGDDKPDPLAVPQKVARVVKQRGINYLVAIDDHNRIGGRFDGGELPTTVIVDPQGNVRRRFIGARSLAVFESMLAEAGLAPANERH